MPIPGMRVITPADGKREIDPSGESLLVSDFPRPDFIDFLYYQACREIHDDFLEQLPGFERLLTGG